MISTLWKIALHTHARDAVSDAERTREAAASRPIGARILRIE